MSKDHPIGTLTSDFDTTKKPTKPKMPENDPVEGSASDKKQQQER